MYSSALSTVEILPLPVGALPKALWLLGTVGLTAYAGAAPGRRIGPFADANGNVPIYGDVRAWAVGLGLGVQLLDLMVPLPYGFVRFASVLGAAGLVSLFATESMRVLDAGTLFGMPLPALPGWLGSASLPAPAASTSTLDGVSSTADVNLDD